MFQFFQLKFSLLKLISKSHFQSMGIHMNLKIGILLQLLQISMLQNTQCSMSPRKSVDNLGTSGKCVIELEIESSDVVNIVANELMFEFMYNALVAFKGLL